MTSRQFYVESGPHYQRVIRARSDRAAIAAVRERDTGDLLGGLVYATEVKGESGREAGAAGTGGGTRDA